MQKLNFHIPIYDWDINVVTIYNKEDEGIEKLLDKIEERHLVQALKKRGFTGKLTKAFNF